MFVLLPLGRQALLSKWMSPKVQTHDSFGAVAQQLSAFFRHHREAQQRLLAEAGPPQEPQPVARGVVEYEDDRAPRVPPCSSPNLPLDTSAPAVYLLIRDPPPDPATLHACGHVVCNQCAVCASGVLGNPVCRVFRFPYAPNGQPAGSLTDLQVDVCGRQTSRGGEGQMEETESLLLSISWAPT